MSSFTWKPINEPFSLNDTNTSEKFNIIENFSDSWSKLTTTNSHTTVTTFSQSNSLSGWEGVISSDFGTRHFQGKDEFHRGIDIAMPQGTSLESNISGKVIASGEATSQGYDDSYGNLVVVQDSIGREHIYAHLEKATVNVGEHIDVGTQLGLIGSTGNSTGSHLHYQIVYDGVSIDPSNFVAQAQNGEGSMYTFTPKHNEYIEVEPLTSAKDIEQIKANLDANEGGGMFDGITNFMDFVNVARTQGLDYAIWGKPFDVVVIDGISSFFGAIFKGIGIFITQNSDLFFLAPSIVFLFLTFMVGRNRFTKWIIPFVIFYLFSKATYYALIGM